MVWFEAAPRRPVSRILSPTSRGAAIYLGQPLPAASCGLPASVETSRFCALREGSLAAWPCSRWGMPGRSCHQDRRWAITPPFHPYLRQTGGVLFLWPCSAGSLRLGVTQHRALWSSDFPRTARSRPRLPGLLGQSHLITRIGQRQENFDPPAGLAPCVLPGGRAQRA